jgi:hypothetical protein
MRRAPVGLAAIAAAAWSLASRPRPADASLIGVLLLGKRDVW